MASAYNPQGLTNNCIFVTVAYLLGVSVDNLPQALRNEMQDTMGVLSLDDDIRPLLELTGRRFCTQSWENGDFELTSAGDRASWRLEQFLMSKWSCSGIGIGYQTVTNFAHFIVVTDAHPPTYMCYQHATEGRDKWQEVRGDWRDLVNDDRTRVLYAFGFPSDRYDNTVDGEVPSYAG